jgi:hypothetical protein
MGWDYSLSASKLNIKKDCKRCFWLHVTKKIKRPRGIYPSLPNGMDLKIKAYFDLYRGEMPPELRGHVPGVLWGTVAEINKLRAWQSGMKPIIQTPHGSVSLIGAIDDLAVDDGLFASVDGKTKGAAAPDGYSERYYQTNADVYALMLRETGRPPSKRSYFWYLNPDSIPYDNGVGQKVGLVDMRFENTVVSIDADPERAMAVICKATELLATTDPNKGPEASGKCEYCNHHTALMAAGF